MERAGHALFPDPHTVHDTLTYWAGPDPGHAEQARANARLLATHDPAALERLGELAVQIEAACRLQGAPDPGRAAWTPEGIAPRLPCWMLANALISDFIYGRIHLLWATQHDPFARVRGPLGLSPAPDYDAEAERHLVEDRSRQRAAARRREV